MIHINVVSTFVLNGKIFANGDAASVSMQLSIFYTFSNLK